MELRFLIAGLIFLNAAPAFAAKVLVSINETSQQMTVSVDGQQEYVWPVSTGLTQYATPTGTYKPFRMEEDHYSVEWDDAPMPHSIFFTPLGHAIHGTEHVAHLGQPASHGCVRLAPENAATLYALVTEAGLANTTVTVQGSAEAFASATPAKQIVKKPIVKKQIVKKRQQQLLEPSPLQLAEPQELVEPPPQQLAEPMPQPLVDETDQQLYEPPEDLFDEEPQQLVENPRSRRLRRADDPFMESYN
jgi:hypothetical protein